MDHSQKTTEFSAHLSWAAMRRFLQEKLTPEASQRVETHLRNCPRCSSAIIDYIQAEEPQHYKQYMKKLKGNLTAAQTAKKRFFSAFQLKAIRTTTAVVALLIFSFFAIKTVVNQSGTERPLPSESLAETKERAPAPAVRRKAASTSPSAQKAKNPKKAEAKPKQVEEKPAAKKASTPRPRPIQKAVVAPKKNEQPSVQPAQVAPAPSVAERAPEPQTPSVAPSPQATAPTENSEEAFGDEPTQEVTKAKPLPTLKKLDAQRENNAVAPLSNRRPTAAPVPGNQIRER